MNTPAEPEGGKPQNLVTTIQVLNNAGNPWKGSKIEHNGKRFYINDKTGEVQLHINGGELYINGFTATKLVRSQVQQGVSTIILQHDSWKGGMKLQQG